VELSTHSLLGFVHCYANELTAIATVLLALFGLITFIVIGWQGHLLRRQLELQTLTGLYTEWNSKEMLEKRVYSFVSDKPTDEELEQVEAVLESLEKLASFYRHGVLTRKLIWDTFGWYVLRYYFYNSGEERFPDEPGKGNIEQIRAKWDHDDTLYCDLKILYDKLLMMECRRRRRTKEAVRESLRKEHNKFIKAEQKLYDEYGKERG